MDVSLFLFLSQLFSTHSVLWWNHIDLITVTFTEWDSLQREAPMLATIFKIPLKVLVSDFACEFLNQMVKFHESS
jgi:hypothetical protein